MKVIQNNADTWKLTVVCDDCKSEIEIHSGDVYYQRLGSFDEFETYFLADCGACGSQITLKKLPEFVKRKAPNR